MGTKYHFSLELPHLEHGRFTTSMWWRNESWYLTDSSCHCCCACIPSAHWEVTCRQFLSARKVSWFSRPGIVFWMLGNAWLRAGEVDSTRRLTPGNHLQTVRDWRGWPDAGTSLRCVLESLPGVPSRTGPQLPTAVTVHQHTLSWLLFAPGVSTEKLILLTT